MTFLDQIGLMFHNLYKIILVMNKTKEIYFVFFVAVIFKNIKIKSFKTRIYDIYRPLKDNYYKQYLISCFKFKVWFENIEVY